ncbi:MAG TPA: hypothetical protein VKB86_15590 [Pyrinomonadaceae bacterium]|nr:hypothetical protein [Pyrinomonadaceae bacterium]
MKTIAIANQKEVITMRKGIIYSAAILLAFSTTIYAHEPVGLKLMREQHQQQARIQADAERQRKQFAEWEKEWQRQEQKRLNVLTYPNTH